MVLFIRVSSNFYSDQSRNVRDTFAVAPEKMNSNTINKSTVRSFYKENKFKPCLTEQRLNMFKLWCEREH